MGILLRKLSWKSLLGFGKHKDLRIEDIMKIDAQYLNWIYYNQSNISFLDDILDKLDITADRRIDKPGKDPNLGRLVKASEFRDMPKLQKYKRIARNKRIRKASKVAMMIRHQKDDNMVMSKASLAHANRGTKGSRLQLGVRPLK